MLQWKPKDWVEKLCLKTKTMGCIFSFGTSPNETFGNLYIHSSICPLFTLFILWWEALVPILSGHRARGGVHSEWVTSSSQGNGDTGHKLSTHTFVSKGNLEKPNAQFWTLEGTHACTWRTFGLQAERPQYLLAAKQQCYRLHHHVLE